MPAGRLSLGREPPRWCLVCYRGLGRKDSLGFGEDAAGEAALDVGWLVCRLVA